MEEPVRFGATKQNLTVIDAALLAARVPAMNPDS